MNLNVLYSVPVVKVYLILVCYGLKLVDAQSIYKIEGYVYDAISKEPLVAASIFCSENNKGTNTNRKGFYSLQKLSKGTYTIRFSYTGYQPDIQMVKLNENYSLNIYLKPQNELKPIIVTADQKESIQEENQTSVIHLQIDKIASLPVILGEPDLIKTIQLLPGIQSGVEGMTGIYVRGGGADQNLIMLDDVPLYNTSHMLGIFSVFNPGLIKSADVLKGGFPAKYGGRLSSVIDIESKSGNYDSLEGDGSIGIMLSRLTLRLPIEKGRTALSISARRSYYDLLVRPVLAIYTAAQDYERINTGYYFYDFNARIDHKISDNQHFTLSSFFARDRFYLKYSTDFDSGESTYKSQLGWGNFFANAQYKHRINNNISFKSSLIFSRYRFFAGLSATFENLDITGTKVFEAKESINFYSLINDIIAKNSFSWQVNNQHVVNFGLDNTYHVFSPGASVIDFLTNETSVNLDGIDTVFNAPNVYANDLRLYAQDEWEISNRLKMNLGLHFNLFTQENYTSLSLQPRINARCLLSPKVSLKASYAKMQQNLHLLTNASIGMPTDLWVPATKRAPSEISHQIAAGLAAKVGNMLDLSIEGYYKTLQNVIEYAEGKIFIGGDQNWEDVIEIGNGKAYGIELLLEKKKGRLSGWLGYTLSWTNRQFDNINRGREFPYKYDRRHDVSLTAKYEINEKINVGIVWVYGTGYSYTLSNGYFYSFPYLNSQTFGNTQGNPLRYNQNRNNFRAPNYHRLDVGLNCLKKKKWGARTWRFGIYNTYNHMNPFLIYWQGEFDFYKRPSSNQKLNILTLLPIMPSVSWAFEF